MPGSTTVTTTESVWPGIAMAVSTDSVSGLPSRIVVTNPGGVFDGSQWRLRYHVEWKGQPFDGTVEPGQSQTFNLPNLKEGDVGPWRYGAERV